MFNATGAALAAAGAAGAAGASASAGAVGAGTVEDKLCVVGEPKFDAGGGGVDKICVAGEEEAMMTARDLDQHLLSEHTSLAGSWILDVSR